MNKQDVVKTLNELIETSKDGQLGFEKSAEQVKDSELAALLRQRAVECRQAATELQSQVTQYGGSPETGGSSSGALHRTWVQVRASLSALGDRAVLDECERAEDHALTRYRSAVTRELPPTLITLINRHLDGVQRNHDQIKALRDKLPE